MDKQEKIYSAAIEFHIEQGRFSLVEVGLCLTYEDCALRRWINNQGLSEIDKEVKGFITTKNRFVDAKEAMEIAIKADQYPNCEYALDTIRRNIYTANEGLKNANYYDKCIFEEQIEEQEKLQNHFSMLAERKELKPEDLY